MRIFLVLLALWGVAGSAWAVPLRVASFNIRQGFEGPGTTSYQGAKAVIQRVAPDVIAILESQASDLANFNTLAAELGYEHKVMSTLSPLDGYLTTGFFSRYPILSSLPIPSGPSGAVEMTRNNLAVKIDVPETERDPLIVAVHYKASWTFGASYNEGFRRAIEIRRTKEFLQANTDVTTDNVLVIGDFNLVGTDNTIYSGLPASLPGTYRTGSDITYPVTYRTDPDFYFSELGMGKLAMRQVNGSSGTFGTSVLDYMVVSASLRNRFYETEIYNSALDGPEVGLPKSGPIPAATASSSASDHLFLFGDFELDREKPLVTGIATSSPFLFHGQTLESLGLGGGQANVAGTFSWPPLSGIPSPGIITRRILFTPEDTNNYSPVAVTTNIAVLAWGQGGLTHNLQWPPAMQIPVNGQGTVYAQIYIPGWTETVEKVAPNVRCWIGVNSQNSDPSGWAESSWKEASLNASQGFGTNADEYTLSLSATDTGAGTFYFAARWQINEGAYGYGGVASGGGGGAWDGTVNTAGVLTVGSTVGTWSSNAPVTSELVGKYAIGGAASVSAASESPVMEAQSNSLSLTAIVRKDDPRLTVGAEWATDLASGWSGEGVSSETNGLVQPTDPGLERRKFTVPYDSANEPRKFLRLKATLAQ